MFADMKRASRDGEIPVSTLPKAIQPSLRAFDLDGSGSISPLELSRGAELYRDSKNQNKKLKKVVIALFVVLSLTVAVISGLTFVVVESAKETNTSPSGVMTVKGSTKPVATAAMLKSDPDLFKLLDMDLTTLSTLTNLDLPINNGTKIMQYKIQGTEVTVSPAREMVLYTARGDTVHINENEWRIKTSAGVTLETVTRAAATAARRRLAGFFACGGSGHGHSFQAGGFKRRSLLCLQTSGSFTMMQSGGF